MTLPSSPSIEGFEFEPDNSLFQKRLDHLIKLRNEVTFEIMRLRSVLGLPLLDRPAWDCKRCGYQWVGYSVEHPPKGCPRCHSPCWNEPPLTDRARRPSDPPHPSWGNKGRTIVAHPPVGKKIKRRKNKNIQVPVPQVAPTVEPVSVSAGLPPPPKVDPAPTWEPLRPLAETLRERIATSDPTLALEPAFVDIPQEEDDGEPRPADDTPTE